MNPLSTTCNPSSPPSKSGRWSTLAEWALYAVLTLLMLHHTWLTWPDLYVDFGRELYNAWSISVGEWPYRDIAHYSGPLSMCVNGVFFALAGVSMHGLFVLNFAVWVGIVWALWRILRRIASTGARMTAISLFILLMSFSRLTGNGNYNYLAPYAHELTHGLLFCLLAILTTNRAFLADRRTARAWLAGAGTLLGLATLTKPEMALAGWMGVLAGIGPQAFGPGPARSSRALGDAAVVGTAALLMVGGAVAGLSLAMPVSVALDGVTLPWRNLFNPQVTQLPYFKLFMGTNDTACSLRHMVPLTALFLGGAGMAWILDQYRLRRWVWTAAGAMAIAATWAVFRSVDSSDFARPLPLFAGLATLSSGLRLWRRCHGPAADSTADRLRWTFGVFSLALLLKILLYARIWHYGFVLAAPAMTLVVTWALDDGPRRWFMRPSVRGLWRILVIGVLLFFGASEWRASNRNLQQLTYSLGQGGDRYRTDTNAAFFDAFLAHARETMPAGSTLSVLPEGAMLNYLLRIPSSVPYTILMPPEVFTFGESSMLEAFRRSPPDFFLLLHKDTSEFGFRFFGRDYGVSLMAWIRTAYEPIWALGSTPLQTEAGGLLLLRRRDAL
jgi:hypothetical protein